VRAVPALFPSTLNCTLVTATLSEAVAVTLTLPETVAFAAGDVTEIVGGVVSPDGGGVFVLLFPLTTPEHPANAKPAKVRMSDIATFKQSLRARCAVFVPTAVIISNPPTAAACTQNSCGNHSHACQGYSSSTRGCNWTRVEKEGRAPHWPSPVQKGMTSRFGQVIAFPNPCLWFVTY
jgi:hypothetical protein